MALQHDNNKMQRQASGVRAHECPRCKHHRDGWHYRDEVGAVHKNCHACREELADIEEAERLALVEQIKDGKKLVREVSKVIDDKQALIKKATKKGVLVDLRGRSEAPQLSDVAIEIIKRFGGVEQFTLEWYNQVSTAMAEAPGKKHTLQAFKDIVAVIAEANRMEKESDEVSSMSDEELDKKIQFEADKLVNARLLEYKKAESELYREPVEPNGQTDGEEHDGDPDEG